MSANQQSLDLSRKLLEEFDIGSVSTVTQQPAVRSVGGGGIGSTAAGTGDMSHDLANFTASILSSITPTKPSVRSAAVGNNAPGTPPAAVPSSSASSGITIPPPRAAASPYSTDAKSLLRESQEEVTELRKALLTASQAVFSAQQELKVEKHKALTLEGERNRAVTGIKSLHRLMEDREIELRMEKQQGERKLTDLEDQIKNLQVEKGSLEKRNKALEEELAEMKSRHVSLLEEMGDIQHQNREQHRKLGECREIIQRKSAEVNKADQFVEGSLSSFLRDANNFTSQWKSLKASLELMSADPMPSSGEDRGFSGGGVAVGTMMGTTAPSAGRSPSAQSRTPGYNNYSSVVEKPSYEFASISQPQGLSSYSNNIQPSSTSRQQSRSNSVNQHQQQQSSTTGIYM